jgi:hypothetical protein
MLIGISLVWSQRHNPLLIFGFLYHNVCISEQELQGFHRLVKRLKICNPLPRHPFDMCTAVYSKISEHLSTCLAKDLCTVNEESQVLEILTQALFQNGYCFNTMLKSGVTVSLSQKSGVFNV